MARFRFLNAAQQMAVSDGADGNVRTIGLSLAEISEGVGGEQYTFAPFSEQPEEGCSWAIKTTIAHDGSIVRRGRLTMDGRTISVRLWDRAVPIPSNAPCRALEFGYALQGGEPVTDVVETPRGLIRVARVYARLLSESAE